MVIDELGHKSYRDQAANLRYRVVNGRYLKGRPIPTITNRPLAVLGDRLQDGEFAEAIPDRLRERGAHLPMRAPPTAPTTSNRWTQAPADRLDATMAEPPYLTRAPPSHAGTSRRPDRPTRLSRRPGRD